MGCYVLKPVIMPTSQEQIKWVGSITDYPHEYYQEIKTGVIVIFAHI